MQKSNIFVALTAATLAIAMMVAASPVTSIAGNGNGAPSGPHYNLNIIGVSKDKTADMTGNNGHRIFVKLTGNTKIMLQEGEDYQVLDANGTDGTASFQLPNPDPDNIGTTRYSVFARALGKPGGSAKMMTCATDPGTLEDVCSIAVLDIGREKGKSTFKNVSKELLYIYVPKDLDLDEDGDVDVEAGRYPLFDDALEGYFWDYDNSGLKLLQLRFYPCATTVPDVEEWLEPVDDSACFD